MKIQEMLEIATADHGKVSITPEQLKQVELFVVAYMSAAQLELLNKELGKSVISGLDIKWDSLFNVKNKQGTS